VPRRSKLESENTRQKVDPEMNKALTKPLELTRADPQNLPQVVMDELSNLWRAYNNMRELEVGQSSSSGSISTSLQNTIKRYSSKTTSCSIHVM
jgi:hypothetical protein